MNRAADVVVGPRKGPGAARIAAALAAALLPYGGAALGLLIVFGRQTRPSHSGEATTLEPRLPDAPQSRRALAGAVDLCLAGALMLVPWVGWAFAAAFLLFRDSFLDGRGAGKRLFGLVAVKSEGGAELNLAGDHLASFARNATIGLPLAQLVLGPVEAVLALAGARRLGDRLAGGTRVVLTSS